MTYTETVLLRLMPHRVPALSEHANVSGNDMWKSVCCGWRLMVALSLCGRGERDWRMGRGKQGVSREELCSMAGPNCLRLPLCVWLCLSMSNTTSHRGASSRANTQTQCWTVEKAFMVLETSVTWHLGQTLSNKAIVAHCLDPPGMVCVSDMQCLSFLTSVSLWELSAQ